MRYAFALLILVAGLTAVPAHAQLGDLGLPQVPNIGGQVPDLGDTLNQTPLEDLRRLRVRELLRQNRRELEADPAGQPIVRSQILGIGLSQAALDQAREAGFEVVRTDAIDDATAMVTLRAPAGLPTRRALRRLRDADPQGVYDFDHLHIESGAAATLPLAGQTSAAQSGPRIGLIDSGVAADIATVERRAFATTAPVVAAHGTRAIADLIESENSGGDSLLRRTGRIWPP